MLSPSDKNIRYYIFFGFVFLLIIHLIFTFTAFYNDDDLIYVEYAADIAKNGFPAEIATSHFQLRWTAVYVTAFFFKLFGITSLSAALCSFISVVGTGFLILKMTSKYNLVTFIFSLLMFFFAYSTLLYMQRILPDVTVCFAIFWMYYSYRSCTEKPSKVTSYALQFSVALMLAIFTKETIILAVPLFFILLVNDLFKKRNTRFWTLAISISFLLFFLYLLYFKITAGSFFFRYSLLQGGSYLSACSYDMLPFSFTLKRIGYLLWRNMLLNGDLLMLIPALAACFYRRKLKLFAAVKDVDFLSFIVLLLAANFMTISATDYVPLCPAPRHFLYLFPFAALLGGPMMYAFFKDPKRFLFLPIFIITATCMLFYLNAGNNKYLFLAFSLLLAGRYIVSFIVDSKTAFTVCALGFIGLFSLNYIVDFVQPKYPFYWDHKKVVERSLRDKKINGTVFAADAFSGSLTEFFLQYDKKHLLVLPIDSVKSHNLGTLYYLHTNMNPAVQASMDSLLKSQDNPALILVDKEQKVSLYQVNNAFLHQLKK